MKQRSLMWLFFGTGVFMLTCFCFAATVHAAQDPLENLYQAAKAEGKVIYWGPIAPEEFDPVVEAFKKRFPGIEVEQFFIRADDFTPRVIAEKRQGKVSYDVGVGRMSVLVPLLERDLVQSYKDWGTIFKDLNTRVINENGRLLTWYNMVYPIAYNTNLVKSEDVPKSWDDLLDPKWKGKLIVEPRGNAFAYLGLKWGEERAVNYAKKLKDQKPIFSKGATATLQQLSAGAAHIAVGALLYKIEQSIKGLDNRKDPVDWAKRVSPLGATNNCNFVMRGAPHPNAAKLLVGYMSSDEGIMVQAKTSFQGPVFPGSPVSWAQELVRNNIELIVESSNNFKKANDINKSVIKALGTY